MTERKIVVLEACAADGKRINGAHRVVEEELEGISPANDGANTLICYKSGRSALALLAPHLVEEKLGWGED